MHKVLAAFAYRQHRAHFTWTDTSIDDPGPAHCRWYWSREGLDPTKRRVIERLLADDQPRSGGPSSSRDPVSGHSARAPST